MPDVDLKSVNLNTVISLTGFLGTFVLIGIAWGSAQSKIADLEEWRLSHDAVHRDLLADMRGNAAATDERIKAIDERLAEMNEVQYRLAQVEKSYDNIDTRISRITESYSNQFSDFRTQLNAISTQIALTNQTLQRMEAVRAEAPRQ
ncbi:hypothetical protein [Mesorhizobium sp.]|uniref:hypothetical protein n=1 Tax=Mesorhizobium sp. TaxID=1871066 RepID=UPI000FE543C7|nr:hypothetical protein [Mesorhizobium sp.]RWP05114.1 MAG: hypothetical protein EOQ99_16725 [Mesorhizobium sp.]